MGQTDLVLDLISSIEWLLAITAADHTGVSGYATEVARMAEVKEQVKLGRFSELQR